MGRFQRPQITRRRFYDLVPAPVRCSNDLNECHSSSGRYPCDNVPCMLNFILLHQHCLHSHFAYNLDSLQTNSHPSLAMHTLLILLLTIPASTTLLSQPINSNLKLSCTSCYLLYILYIFSNLQAVHASLRLAQ